MNETKWYVFYVTDEKTNKLGVRGFVQVAEIEGEENEAEFPIYAPDDMLDYIEEHWLGFEFGALDDVPGNEDGFDPGKIDHWRALANIGNNGYVAVNELTEEEFDEYLLAKPGGAGEAD